MWKTLFLLAGMLAVGMGLEPRREEEWRRSPPDRVEVVSSALKVLPRRHHHRTARSTPWRKPRDYEFVTRGGEGARAPRRLPYPDEENYQPQYVDKYSSGTTVRDYVDRRRDYPNRRIIYYASLPEVIRRPGEWTPPRPIYYPPPSHNEIVTRVQSGLIDVSNPNNLYDKYQNSKYPYDNKYSQTDRFVEELPPRFTIIDAEPPYNRPPVPPPRPYDRFDYRRHDYNRYDYRDPYTSFYEQPSYHHQQLPSQPVTVVRRPVEVRPLDVRPLDLVPLHPLSTQAPPLVSSSTTADPATSTQKSPQGLGSYEREGKSQ